MAAAAAIPAAEAAAFAIPATAAAEAGTMLGAGSMMAGLPWEAGIMAGEAGAMLGANQAFGALAPAMPWGDMAMAGAKGLLGGGSEPQPMPSGGGGRPGQTSQAQAIPTFDYGAPTAQPISMAELMRQREEMMRRRMQRGY
jgi:hypothetical protein